LPKPQRISKRIPQAELESLFIGYGYTPYFVEGSDPAVMHRQVAEVMDKVFAQIKAIQHDARVNGVRERLRWPLAPILRRWAVRTLCCLAVALGRTAL